MMSRGRFLMAIAIVPLVVILCVRKGYTSECIYPVWIMTITSFDSRAVALDSADDAAELAKLERYQWSDHVRLTYGSRLDTIEMRWSWHRHPRVINLTRIVTEQARIMSLRPGAILIPMLLGGCDDHYLGCGWPDERYLQVPVGKWEVVGEDAVHHRGVLIVREKRATFNYTVDEQGMNYTVAFDVTVDPDG